MVDVVYFEPRKTNVFVTPGGSNKRIANITNRRVAYKFVFEPASNYFAKEEQMYGFVPKGGKTNVTLFRKACLQWLILLVDELPCFSQKVHLSQEK
ncbi:hypothetical protein Y032_0002g1093 [Ancylostoma ceylanicum]|uniref:MSP domain-containing protein n=1 Tax=Ancylostoma ceylanicum TaxID=53326 RepID=A0A016VZM0_9BILA|nr:hypothetical protein Y032_0002g1093 [Ancylostoma ceylanicum]